MASEQGPRLSPQNAGFTLAEVMVAVTILAIGVLAWAALQSHNIRYRDASGRMTVAIQLAQSSIEDLADAASDWDPSEGLIYSNVTNQTLNNIPFAITETVNGTTRLFPDGKSMWRIQVDVGWDHFGQKNVHLERLVMGDYDGT
ncbi:MAG: type IV pilus modification PilV family protein [Desulfohalobiaceae bacterium]